MLLLLLLLSVLSAAGGVLMHAITGDPGAAFIGLGSAALLGMSAVAMSDMQGTGGGANVVGELGVKAAFGESCCCSRTFAVCWSQPVMHVTTTPQMLTVILYAFISCGRISHVMYAPRSQPA